MSLLNNPASPGKPLLPGKYISDKAMGEKRIKLTDVPKSQGRAQAGPIKPTPIKQTMQHLFTFAENTLKCSLQENYSWKETPKKAAPDISCKGHLAPAVSSGAAVGHGCVTQTAPH